MSERIRTFQEFYPFYLREHARPLNRLLHFIGLLLVFAWVCFCVFNEQWAWLWGAPLIGYALAWIGHFVIERNRPATFRYPFFSLCGDFRMFFDILRHRRLDFDKSDAL